MTVSESTNLYVNPSNNPFAKKDEQGVGNSVTEKQATSEIVLYGDNSTPAPQTSTNNNGNIGLVSQEALLADENMGLGIQRTTTTNPVIKPQSANPTVSTTSTSATTESSQPKSKFPAYAENDPVWAQNAENNKKSGKPRFEQVLRNFFGNDKFENMSPEEKEEAAIRYFEWLASDKKDVISQSRQFELYMNRCESAEEYEFLCSVIDKMDASEQAKAVDTVLNKGSEGQQTVATHAVFNDLDNYADSSQNDIKQLLRDKLASMPIDKRMETLESFSQQINTMREEGASPEEIRERVNTQVNALLDVSEDENVDEDTRISAGIEATATVSLAHRDDQLELGQRALSSKFKDVRVAMANEGHNLHVDNQSQFVDMAMGLEDEDVANAIANNAYNYDESLRDYVIDLLKNSGYDSVNETLNRAEQRYNESKANSKSSSDESSSEIDSTSSKEETATTSSRISMQEGVERIISDNRLNVTQKANKIKGLTNKEQQMLAISKMVPSSTLPEIKNLILSGLKSEVFDYLLSNVTPENMTTLDSIKQFMQPQHVKKYNEILGLKDNNSVVSDATNVITSQRRNFFIS